MSCPVTIALAFEAGEEGMVTQLIRELWTQVSDTSKSASLRSNYHLVLWRFWLFNQQSIFDWFCPQKSLYWFDFDFCRQI